MRIGNKRRKITKGETNRSTQYMKWAGTGWYGIACIFRLQDGAVLDEERRPFDIHTCDKKRVHP